MFGCERSTETVVDKVAESDKITNSVYVDEHQCSGCHQTEYAAWKGSHHALAMNTAEESTVLGIFDSVMHHLSGIRSRFFTRNDSFFVNSSPGTASYATLHITHTFGIEPLQQYLAEIGSGRYQVYPIAWDVQNRKWFNADGTGRIPESDELHWQRPLHNWNYMCAECHATGLLRGYNTTENSYATTAHQFNVGCQACHGPGSNHVREAQHKNKPLSNYSTNDLSAQKFQIDVCAQCHSRRAPLSDGHSLERGLHDDYLVSALEPELYFDDGQIKAEVYEYGSFLQSRMHGVGMMCSDCHNPHTGTTWARGNELCVTCHSEQRNFSKLPGGRDASNNKNIERIDFSGLKARNYDSYEHHFHQKGSAGALCVSCHAPTRAYMQIDPRHDHSFRVPRPDLSVKYGVPNACTSCHRDKSSQWAADILNKRDVQNGYNVTTSESRRNKYLDAISSARRGRPDSDEMLRKIVENTMYPSIMRATAISALSDSEKPTVSLCIAMLHDPDAMVRRSAVEYLGALPQSEQTSQALRSALSDASRSVRFSAFIFGTEFLSSPEYSRVRNEYVSAQHQLGGMGDGAINLGTLAEREGDTAEAERMYRKALMENEASVPAIVNLAEIIRRRSDMECDRFLTEQILRIPVSAPLQYSLALSRLRQKRYAEAIINLRTAITLDPANKIYEEV